MLRWLAGPGWHKCAPLLQFSAGSASLVNGCDCSDGLSRAELLPLTQRRRASTPDAAASANVDESKPTFHEGVMSCHMQIRVDYTRVAGKTLCFRVLPEDLGPSAEIIGPVLGMAASDDLHIKNGSVDRWGLVPGGPQNAEDFSNLGITQNFQFIHVGCPLAEATSTDGREGAVGPLELRDRQQVASYPRPGGEGSEPREQRRPHGTGAELQRVAMLEGLMNRQNLL